MIDYRQLRLVLAAAAIGLLPAQAQAASALAVGVTGKSSEGIAIGVSYNHGTVQEAERTAMQTCQNFKTAPKAAKRCRLIGSLPKGCVGIAFDPKDDSPGMGWSVTETREDAESSSISACQNAVPAARKKFCKISTLKCDGDPPVKKQ